MAALTRSADKGSLNNFGVKNVEGLDYSTTNTGGLLTTKVYHGVSISSGDNASVIGRIQSWQPDSYTRDGIHLYELANISFGRPVEFIPGKATGFTIAVTRAEVWESEMELAFGFSLFDDLIDQNRPFSVREFWIKGNATSGSQVWDYKGCWFTSKNIDAITSDGDGVTKISATLAYVSRLKSVVVP
jgi:hypothetical protein